MADRETRSVEELARRGEATRRERKRKQRRRKRHFSQCQWISVLWRENALKNGKKKGRRVR